MSGFLAKGSTTKNKMAAAMRIMAAIGRAVFAKPNSIPRGIPATADCQKENLESRCRIHRSKAKLARRSMV